MNNRNDGIDLLRIISMFMVVILHVLLCSGRLTTRLLSARYEISWLVEISAFCAVNCFALISGYVGVKSRYRYSNLAILWLRVVFYSVIITVIYVLFGQGTGGKKEIFTSFFPLTEGIYWYFTAYAFLFLFLPIINKGLISVSDDQRKKSVVLLLIATSGLQIIKNKEIFGTANGYSVLWLLILYLLGATINLNEWFAKGTKRYLLGYISMIGITFGSFYFLEHRNSIDFSYIQNQKILINYCSPTILFAAIFLFAFFKNLKINNRLSKKIISTISPLAFSVYIVHSHPQVWANTLAVYLPNFIVINPIVDIIIVLITSVIIFIFCLFVDYFRSVVTRLFMIDERIRVLFDK